MSMSKPSSSEKNSARNVMYRSCETQALGKDWHKSAGNGAR